MRLLVITHWPSKSTSSRAMELAAEMAKRVSVCWLDWDTSDVSSPHRSVRMVKRITHALSKRFQGFSKTRHGDLDFVTMPYLLAKPYSLLSDDVVWGFNRKSLLELIRSEKITHILNANATFFPTNNLEGVKVVYDVVDYHPAVGGNRADAIEDFMKREIQSAPKTISISYALNELVKERWGIEPIWVPNGGEPSKFRDVTEDQISQLKKRWGLEGKKVIGCIGNHNRWAGLDLMVEAFTLLRKDNPNVVLFIVGPGMEVDALVSRGNIPDGVILTGPVPPAEIGPYFRALDVGTLPFTQEPFTDNALPIKIIEYGFAGKPVVSTPLKELCTLAFPHVKLVERTPEAWKPALEEALTTKWNTVWDEALGTYTWSAQAERILSILEGI